MTGDRSQEHSLLQQSKHSMHKEDECKYDLDAAECKMPVENRKIVVRSRYFQNKSVKKNDRDNEIEKLLVNNDDATDICKNNSPQSPPFENNYGATMKRKPTSTGSIQPVGAFSLIALTSYIFLLIFLILYSMLHDFTGCESQVHADKCISCQSKYVSLTRAIKALYVLFIIFRWTFCSIK